MVTAKKTNVNKYQIGLIPSFAFIEYKVQVATFEFVVLDLRKKSKKRGGKSYKRFCSTYVQLSWLQILQSIILLKKINFDNIDNKPYDKLQAKNN